MILINYNINTAFYFYIDENGGIIVGLKGEKICNYFSFYAVFQEEETYKVLSSNGEIGTLNKCPAIGEVFVLAGRAWIVISVDEERKTIYVNQTKSSRIPSWEGGGGDIHSKVLQKMKSILMEETIYPYMQKNAIKVLTDARKIAKDSGIRTNHISKVLSELKIEDDKDDKGFTEYIKQIIRKIRSYR